MMESVKREEGREDFARRYARRVWKSARKQSEREARKFKRDSILDEFALMCQGRLDDLSARGLLHAKKAWAARCGMGLMISLLAEEGGERVKGHLVLFVDSMDGDVGRMARYAAQRAMFALLGKRRFFEWKWRAVEKMLARMDERLAKVEWGVQTCPAGVAALAESEALSRAAEPSAGKAVLAPRL